MRRDAGFTFAELFTALGLGLILTAIAAPNLVEYQREYRLVSAANQVGFDVARARMKAVGERSYYRVKFNSGENTRTYWLEKSDDGTTYTQDGPVITLPGGVTFSSAQNASFDRQGIGAGQIQVVVRNEDGPAKTVRVSALGRVTIQ